MIDIEGTVFAIHAEHVAIDAGKGQVIVKLFKKDAFDKCYRINTPVDDLVDVF